MSNRLEETALSVVLAKWNTDEAIKERNHLYNENKIVRLLMDFCIDQDVYFVLKFEQAYKFAYTNTLYRNVQHIFFEGNSKSQIMFARQKIREQNEDEYEFVYYWGNDKQGYDCSDDLADLMRAIIAAMKNDVHIYGPYFTKAISCEPMSN
jgi:hypothetical protein